MLGEVPEDNRDNDNGILNMLRRMLQRAALTAAQSLWSMMIPLLRVLLILMTMCIVSTLAYYLLRHALLPKILLEEPLYFDYSRSPPIARVSLLAHEKQWYYLKDCLPTTVSARDRQYVSDGGGDYLSIGGGAERDNDVEEGNDINVSTSAGSDEVAYDERAATTTVTRARTQNEKIQ